MKHIRFKIISIYIISLIISVFIMYHIIPVLLNYGPDTINTEFDKVMSGGLMYYQQILLISIILVFLITIFLSVVLKDINKYEYYKKKLEATGEKKYINKLNKIRKICFTLPNHLFIALVFIPVILELFLLLAQAYTSSSDFKLVLIIFIITTIAISLDNIFVKRILKNILVDLKNDSLPEKKTTVFARLILQIVPLLAVCILFTFLVISSIYEQNKGQLLSKYYTVQFEYISKKAKLNNYKDVINEFKNIDLSQDSDILFITDANYNFIYSTGNLSDFFKEYAKEYSSKNNNTIYDFYGTYGQGVIYKIQINGSTYYIGSHYLIYSLETSATMFFSVLFIFFLNLIILIVFSRELSKELDSIENSLETIYNENKLYDKMYVTSNDELGELIFSMNKIQELNNKNVKQIKDNQDMLMEKERLASLGQLIGGIAHNLKTPIMSIAGASEGLNDLIKEYDSSIGDSEVTPQDHHDIAKDMSVWVEKIKNYTEYMSDVITAVKGQAVVMSEQDSYKFTVDELVKRVDILMKHELKNALISLNTFVNVDGSFELTGNVNSLVQVINNMISNAIQAYNGRTNESIDLTIYKESSNIIISIKDNAGGLPKEVSDKLFKEMITTKGKNGTGLGLFMSYSNIRAHFNGNVIVDTTPGVGTEFKIVLPI